MSRIDDLVAEHCPAGVEFKTLGEVGEFVRGNGLQKVDFVEAGFPCIHYGQIYTFYGTSTTTTKSFVTAEHAARLKQATTGDLVVTTTSENIADVCTAVAWLGEPPIAIGGHSCVFRHTLDPMYAAYYFQTEQFEVQKRKFVTGTKVKDIKVADIGRIKIPVPPLAVQREIAGILDRMEMLKAELEAELEYRSRQYAYYRKLLLRPPAQSPFWEKVRLRDVADILVGFPFKSANFTDAPTEARLLRGDNIGQGRFKPHDYKRWSRADDDGLERYELGPGDVVLAMDRPWIPAGLKWSQVRPPDLPALLVQRVARMRADSSRLDREFLGCIIGSPGFTAHVLRVQTGNTVPHLSAAQIGDFEFELPPMAEQVLLTGRMKSFDALVNDLSIGLPAEIAARRKQYEYYRDKLLTFEEAA